MSATSPPVLPKTFSSSSQAPCGMLQQQLNLSQTHSRPTLTRKLVYKTHHDRVEHWPIEKSVKDDLQQTSQQQPARALREAY